MAHCLDTDTQACFNSRSAERCRPVRGNGRVFETTYKQPDNQTKMFTPNPLVNTVPADRPVYL